MPEPDIDREASLDSDQLQLLSALKKLGFGSTIPAIGREVGREISVRTMSPLVRAGLAFEVELMKPPYTGFSLTEKGDELLTISAAGSVDLCSDQETREGSGGNLGSPEEDTVTVMEAARLLGIDRDNVYRGIKKGRIPSVTVDGKIRVPLAAVEQRRWAPGSIDVLRAIMGPAGPAVSSAARLVYACLFVNFGNAVRGPLNVAVLEKGTRLKVAEVLGALDELARHGLVVREQRPKGPSYGELHPPWAPYNVAGRKGAT